MSDLARQAAGQPTGGQFKATAGTDAGIDLTRDRPTLQTDAPLETFRASPSARSSRELVRLAEEGQIDTSPPYQRGDVWTQDQRVALIRSMIQRIPVPSLIMNARIDADPTWDASKPAYALIDGKQRLETMRQWYAGELPVPASWFPPEDVETTVDTDDGPYVTHAGLTQPTRRHQGNMWTIPTSEAQLATVEDEAQTYLLVNGCGTPQSDADMENARSYTR